MNKLQRMVELFSAFGQRVMESLAGMGIYPYSFDDAAKAEFDEVMLKLSGQDQRDVKDLAADHYEVSCWGNFERFLQYTTGRVFRLGMPVWLHNRHSSGHEIVAKGILVAFDSDNPGYYIRQEGDKWILYSNCFTRIHKVEGTTDCGGGKLWCVERIKEEDLLKSVAEMRAEREEIEQKCRAAEVDRAVSLRMVSREAAMKRFNVDMMGATGEWLAADRDLWDTLITQVCAQENVADPKSLKPWVVLKEPALSMYETWAAH